MKVTYTLPRFADDSKIGHRMYAEMFVPLPIDTVFGFFSDAHQLERITPPWLAFEILTPSPIQMHPGALLDYKLKLRGIPIKWQTEICQWEPPHGFTDQQLKGPYKRWFHRHIFESTSDGTNVYDDVHYIVPFGKIVDRLFVQAELKKIFTYRQEQLCEIFTDLVAAQALQVHS